MKGVCGKLNYTIHTKAMENALRPLLPLKTMPSHRMMMHLVTKGILIRGCLRFLCLSYIYVYVERMSGCYV